MEIKKAEFTLSAPRESMCPQDNKPEYGYAAIDAWACVKMYRELCRLKETGDYELVVTDQENEEDNSKER